MNVKAVLIKLRAIRALRDAGFSDVELCHAFDLAATGQLRRLVFQLEETEKEAEASDRAHPPETYEG